MEPKAPAKPKPDKKTTATLQPDWRTVCRNRALQQAEAEARKLKKRRSAKGLPFNYRWEHVRAVTALARWLATVTGADIEVVEAAAWLHDVCKGEPNHGVAGAKEAKKILERTDFPAEKIPVVVDAIAQHVGLYRQPGARPLVPLEAAVLWDADKLSKLGAQALAATLSMDYMSGLGLDQRRKSMFEFTHSVLRRTVESMNTLEARAMAETRYREMIAFLEAWEREAEIEDEELGE